ncbi:MULTISPECIES: hypothetical protein [unclassified Microcoleus]
MSLTTTGDRANSENISNRCAAAHFTSYYKSLFLSTSVRSFGMQVL